MTAPTIAAGSKSLADELGLPLIKYTQRAGKPLFDMVLERQDGRLQLRDLRENAPGPIHVDFLDDAAAWRRETTGKRDMLARAVGIKQGVERPLVLDATAGLGRDAFTLCWLGCRVIAFERNFIVYKLLEDGVFRAFESDDEAGDAVRRRLVVGRADAREYLAGLAPDARPDVVYLDPMFPERKKTAAVKKEMQYLQALLGEEEDAAALFEAALKFARKRVFVKRPLHAPPLAAAKPSNVHEGKSVRFDVYVIAPH
ncbi:MAG: class I SAM-dependent methyltransferase [Planctomycetes bacterium]|nr:class I SAM-dependent methyltransferase [Planctomycetota bacterium]